MHQCLERNHSSSVLWLIFLWLHFICLTAQHHCAVLQRLHMSPIKPSELLASWPEGICTISLNKLEAASSWNRYYIVTAGTSQRIITKKKTLQSPSQEVLDFNIRKSSFLFIMHPPFTVTTKVNMGTVDNKSSLTHVTHFWEHFWISRCEWPFTPALHPSTTKQKKWHRQ